MKHTIRLLVFMVWFVFSCSQIEKQKEELVNAAQDKVTGVAAEVWKKGMEETFQHSATLSACQFEDIYGKNHNLEIKDQKGRRIEYMGNFFQCFLVYRSDKDKMLNFLSGLKTRHPEISDKSYTATDRSGIAEKLSFVKSKLPDMYQAIDFFRGFEKEGSIEYYTVSKYPYSNLIMYDKKNNLIYHFVENYQD